METGTSLRVPADVVFRRFFQQKLLCGVPLIVSLSNHNKGDFDFLRGGGGGGGSSGSDMVFSTFLVRYFSKNLNLNKGYNDRY